MLLIKEGRNYSVMAECPKSQIPPSFWVLPFSKIIATILGKEKFVSIVFIRQEKMRGLNKKYRGINTSTDVLSFNIGDGGEIFLSLNDARKKASDFGQQFKMGISDFLPYLLIHALLHLKGEVHSSKMNRLESKYCKIFQINYPSNESR